MLVDFKLEELKLEAEAYKLPVRKQFPELAGHWHFSSRSSVGSESQLAPSMEGGHLGEDDVGEAPLPVTVRLPAGQPPGGPQPE